MNYSELQREVIVIIKDQSPEILASVPDYINEAIGQIAEEVKFPELRQLCSVATSTSTYYTNMPAYFSSRLSYAGDSNGKFTILDTLEELLDMYPALDESGNVQYVVCEGSLLYYQPIPTVSTSITCMGYFAPTLLVNDTDTPSFIPDFLHRESIVIKAASVAYNIIEDGIEGDKVNTKILTALAENGINKIREYISRRRSVTSKSAWNF